MAKPPPSPSKAKNGGKRAPAPSAAGAFPIVGIGASAGGLEAFQQLLRNLPLDTGMAFVLVQHLDPTHESKLKEILSGSTKMPVTQAKQGMLVWPNRVHIIPPNSSMTMRRGRLRLEPRTDGKVPSRAIDVFFRSLAAARRNNAIGVILSGTASDGVAGTAAIKEAGGITFAQDSATAKYYGMPHNAIVSGAVDFVLPPKKIAQHLARIARHDYIRLPQSEDGEQLQPDARSPLPQLFSLLKKSFGADFSRYKPSTVHRRIHRRMALCNLDDPARYLDHVRNHPEELQALYRDMFVGVTQFFREPDTFAALKKAVFPRILKHTSRDVPLRIWVPGCSTGEEVYSLAMALLEFLGEKAGSVRVQLFGTDINEDAVKKARHGKYPESVAHDVGRARLRRFFIKADGGYQVNKAVRDLCIFAQHDVLRDPPFSRLDLLSCRNLLIYLDASLHRKLIPLFHYALKPHGFLALGSAETIGDSTLFSLADRKHKIYARKLAVNQPHFDVIRDRFPGQAPSAPPEPPAGRTESDLQKDAADSLMLNHYSPAAVLVNDHMEILHFRGRTGPYLEPATGAASFNLLKMARGGLPMALRAALETARKKNITVEKDGLRLESNGGEKLVRLHVAPLKAPGSRQRAYLIVFEDCTPVIEGKQRPAPPPGKAAASLEQQARMAQLRQELASTKSYLHSLIEDLEATNEELRSVNEEILSTNEEMQSTTEELETANEELQSTNEELNTVNEELGHRNAEVHIANNDIINLLTATNLTVILLDRGLHIRRFTVAAQKTQNLITTDVGRPLSDIRLAIEIPELEERVQQVMDTATAQQFDALSHDGRWHSAQIRPYITTDGKIDGAILMMSDVHEARQASIAMQDLNQRLAAENTRREQAERMFRELIESAPEATVITDAQGRITLVNAQAEALFGYQREQFAGQQIETLLAAPYRQRVASHREAFKAGAQDAQVEVGFELVARRKDGLEFPIEMNASPIHTADGLLISASFSDITFRQQALEDARQSAVMDERNRLASEIHDTLAQGFTAIILQLEVLHGRITDPELRERLEKVSHLARANLEDARRSILMLRPGDRMTADLDVNLGRYVGAIADGVSTRVVFTVEGERRPVPSRKAEDLLRIAQESVTNALKHSGPGEIRVELVYGEKNLALCIANDGEGFNVDNPPRRGVGLSSIRERAARVGGQLQIKSKPDVDGTAINVVVPLD